MKPILCPSSTAEPGHLLHGVVVDGRVVPLDRAVPVDEGFLTKARLHGEPRSRMRFASPCAGSGCEHFAGGRCGVADRVVKPENEPIPLQPCAIRDGCRWWKQEGPAACATCPTVVAIR